MNERACASASREETATRVREMLRGFAASQMLLSAHELGVFEALRDDALALDALARRLELQPGPLERLLIGCSSVGLLTRTGERFALSELARRHLLCGEPGYEGEMFAHFKHDVYPLWHHLSDAVREGRDQWHKVPGSQPGGIFASLYADPQRLRGFMAAMFAKSRVAAREALTRFDFARFAHAVDLGAATGGFTLTLCEHHAGLRATLVDLAPVEAPARETIAAHGLSERVEFVVADFFTEALPRGGDLYILGSILHDWRREEGLCLLRRVREVIAPGGVVFVSEMLLDERREGPFLTAVSHLNMLVLTQGEERTGSDYEAMLREAGFIETAHQHCEGPAGFVVGRAPSQESGT